MQHDTTLTAARIGKGKAVHHYYPGSTRTSCAAGGMGDAPATIVEGPITCKTCLKALARDVEVAHAKAIELDAQHEAQAQVVRDEAAPAVGFEPNQTWQAQDGGVLRLLQAVAEIGTGQPGWTARIERHADARQIGAEVYVTERTLRESGFTQVALAKPVYVRSILTGIVHAVEGAQGPSVWLRPAGEREAVWETVGSFRQGYVASCAHGLSQGTCARPPCRAIAPAIGDRVRLRSSGLTGYVSMVSSSGLFMRALDEDSIEMGGLVIDFVPAPADVPLRYGDQVVELKSGLPGRVTFVGGDWAARVLHVKLESGPEIVGMADSFVPRYRPCPAPHSSSWAVLDSVPLPPVGARLVQLNLVDYGNRAMRFGTFLEANAEAMRMVRAGS